MDQTHNDNANVTIPEGTWPITMKDENGNDMVAFIDAGVYEYGGAAALFIRSFNEEYGDFELYEYITTNVPGSFLMNPETDVIVNHNMPDDAVQAVIDAGVIEENPYTQVRSGFVRMPVHAMTDKAREWFYSRPFVQEFYEEK